MIGMGRRTDAGKGRGLAKRRAGPCVFLIFGCTGSSPLLSLLSSCGERGLVLAVASLITEYGLWACRLSR